MSRLVGWVTGRLLALAVRGWPVHHRGDLAREWAAELHALAHEPGTGGGLRAWRQLRFAASLVRAGATAAAAGGGGRLRLGGLEAAVTRTVVLFIAAVAAVALAMAVVFPLWAVAPNAAASPGLATIGLLARVGAGVLVGLLLARHAVRDGLPGGWVPPVVALFAGTVAAEAMVRNVSSMDAGGPLAVAGMTAAGLLVVPVAAGLAALARRRRLTALAVAVPAAPAVVLAATAAVVGLADRPPDAGEGPLWWLSRLLWVRPPPHYVDHPDPQPYLIESLLPHLPGILLTSVTLALTYALRLARPGTARPAAVPAAPADDPAPGIAADPRWHRVALGCGAFAVVAWAVTLAYLTPNIGLAPEWARPEEVVLTGWPDWRTSEGLLWMHELRLFAIVVAALSLLIAAAYRGAPLLPALGGAVVLLAVDTGVAAAGWDTPRALPVLAVAGLLVGAAAWRACAWFAARDRRGPARRRTLLLTVTVLAAFLAPGIYVGRIVPVPGVQTPPSVLLAAVGLPTALAVLAGLGVAALSPQSRLSAWRVPCAAGSMALLAGLLFFLDGIPPLLGFAAPALNLPAAGLAWAAIHRPRLPRWGWVGVLPLAIGAGLPIGYGTIFASFVLSPVLRVPLGYQLGFDGIPYVAGALLLGLVLARAGTRSDAAPAPVTTLPAPAGPPSSAVPVAPAARPAELTG
ncbi:hypothetical protein [Micromonospora sp. CPCC 206061]|uniref:hypothetical protein n=1 Tax=Micromonospora sp. CPCC 206061 TaxID=3122410 RepID=UPI002FF22B48